jgi:hypothetical protein
VLSTIYWAAGLFGGAVTFMDVCGLLAGPDDSGHGDADHHHAGDHGSGDPHHHTGGTDHAHETGGDTLARGHVVLSMLRRARLFVYFCLGSGPMGLAALYSGVGETGSLAYAGAAGTVAVGLALAFFRITRSEADSTITAADLTLELGEILIGVGPGEMGKVRVRVGAGTRDCFALPADGKSVFAKGARVRVASVADDCVYLEAAGELSGSEPRRLPTRLKERE